LRLRRKTFPPLPPTNVVIASAAKQSVAGCGVLSDTLPLSDTDCFGRRASSLAMTVLASCAAIHHSTIINHHSKRGDATRHDNAHSLPPFFNNHSTFIIRNGSGRHRLLRHSLRSLLAMTGLFRGGGKGFAAAPQNLSPITHTNVVIASAAKQSVAGCAVLSDTLPLSDTDCFDRRASSLAMTVLAGCAPFIIHHSTFINRKGAPPDTTTRIRCRQFINHHSYINNRNGSDRHRLLRRLRYASAPRNDGAF